MAEFGYATDDAVLGIPARDLAAAQTWSLPAT